MLTSLLLSVATGCIDYSFGGNKDELGGADDTGHTATGTIEWPPDSECDIELPEPYEVGLTDLCEYDVGAFNPIAEWTVGQGKFSWAAAAVADLDGDGAPEVVTTFADSPFGTGDSLMPTGYLVAFRGDGTPYWEVRDFPLGMSSSPAVVDVDADGTPEIFVVREYANSMLADGDYTLLMLDAQGQLIWESEHFLGVDFDYATSVSVSDMDHDGSPEIVAGRIIFNVDGTVRGEGEHGRGSYGVMVDPIFGLTVTEATSPAIADLDLDGEEEVITGNAFYDADGNTVWYDPYQEDGMIAVANLDDDPEGEFVASSYNTIRAVDTDGTILWGPKNIRSANIMSPAAIGDIDEDGYPEIITAGGNKLLALNHDGSTLWTADVTDETGATGASIFDFEGDGIPEVVYIDEVEMVAYDGPTGAVKFYNADHSSNTMMDCPVIADVDADGHVEILVAHANFNTALSAFGDRDDSWAPARKIWNQHQYSITNVNDDLTAPRFGTQNFEVYNSWKSAIDRPPGEALGWDLESDISEVCEEDCDAGLVWIVAQVGNKSEDELPGGVHVTLYGLDGGERIPLSTLTTVDAIPGGMSSEALVFKVDVADLTDIDGFWLNVDDDGTGTGFYSECSEDNNDFLWMGPFCE